MFGFIEVTHIQVAVTDAVVGIGQCRFIFSFLQADAAFQPVYSTAGFYSLPNTGRAVYSMNPAWRFHDARLLANPASRSRVADFDPN